MLKRRSVWRKLALPWLTVWSVRVLAVAVVLALVGVVLLVLWRGPWWFDGKYLKGADYKSGAGVLVTGFRTTMVQVLIGLGAVVALWYTARNYRLTRRGQVTDRFIKALERLDSREMYVRIGGVLALEQIVQDAPDQATHAAQVLGAFIRGRARPRPTGRPDEDVQAALTALTRHASRRHVNHDQYIDLRNLVLYGADLAGADLTGARLDRAILSGADLSGADLAGADLTGARLEGMEEDSFEMNPQLNGANLLTAKGLTGEQVAAAVLDSSTQLPSDIAADPAVTARITEVETKHELGEPEAWQNHDEAEDH